ncbi:MAG: ABC transporter permease [Mediterranea sp.]|nr:ABC transporter permease [Mediterranea sp.]
MNLFIKQGIRNVHRNIKPTLLNGAGITLVVVVLLLVLSLSEGIEQQMVAQNIRFEMGACTVSFNKKCVSFKRKEEGNRLLDKTLLYLKDSPFVGSYSSRMDLPTNQLYHNDQAESAYIIGLAEADVALIGEMFRMQAGDAQIARTKGIVVSNALAEQLHAAVGDECSIMSQTVDGSVNLDEFVIRGIFQYTSLANKSRIYMDYEEAKQLYNANLPTRIIVNVRELQDAEAVKRGLLAAWGYTGDTRGEVEYKGAKASCYLDHIGMARSLSSINRYSMLAIAFFLLLISFIGVWSMQAENINERYREIGTLCSLGFKTSSVRWVFAYESLYISGLFFMGGLLIVGCVVAYIQSKGGVYLGESASFAFGSTMVNPILTWRHIVIVCILVLVYPLIATLLSLSSIRHKSIVSLLNS